MKAKRLLRRTLTRTASYLSSPPLNFSSSAPKSAAEAPKKKWTMFLGDPLPAGAAVKPQPPRTIQFRDDICNSASFVGTVMGPVQRLDAPGGGIGACANLLVKNSSGKNSFKILLKMWDEMAEMCLEHIKQNDFLHVSGRVESYAKTDENENSQMCYEVIVKEINYVTGREHSPIDKSGEQPDSRGNLEKSGEHNPIDKSGEQQDSRESEHSPIDKSAGQSEHSLIPKNAGQSDSGGVSSLHKARLCLWQQFFTNPSEWSDNRTKKLEPKHPDFKHKDSGEALWIYYNDPPWLKERLQQFDSKLVARDHKLPIGVSSLEKHKARIRLWKQFFTNPSKWDDNRKKKVKPNSPDFKHEDSGEALWISDNDPPWLKEQLQQLDSKLAAQDHKPPTGESFRQDPGESGLEKYRARLHLWQMFFAGPYEWYDNRNKKQKPNQPDFKHKDTGEALWINPRDPPWVKIQLEQLDYKLAARNRKQDSTSKFSSFL